MDVTPESVCAGKVSYDTRAEAAQAARANRAKWGGRWHAYRCPFCMKHHSGHIARVTGNGIGGKSARRTNRRPERVYA